MAIGGAIFLDPFQAFRGILEKCLLEVMCLELKAASKNTLKNVQEAFLLTSFKSFRIYFLGFGNYK